MRVLKVLGAAVAAATVSVAPTMAGDFLLDQGTQPVGSGRTVGTDSDWRVFQPFDVTDDAGWRVTAIQLDGWRVTGTGEMEVTIRDEADGNTLATTFITFTNEDSRQSQWESGAVDVVLPGNERFVVQIEAVDPFDTWNAIFLGTSGLDSFSRNNSGGEFPAGPIALRLEGTVVPAPGALALLGIAGLATRRRRRCL